MRNDKKRLIFASNNAHKLSEVKAIFKEVDIDIFSLKDLHIDIDPEENGKTFEENAKLQLLSGRYGPYIVCDGQNYRLPKAMQERVAELTY
ncbi:MAG: hypothetical protein MJ151_04070, partial [Lachnospiraceae bacterium]|nr:hypothetical protein [Lachnospiraceae bacterium]